MEYFIGVDTGGTFTDLVVIGENGMSAQTKVPTTLNMDNLHQGLEALCASLDISLATLLSNTKRFVVGTTFATNAVLQRNRDGRTGLLVTKGFKDTLFIRRMMRTSTFDSQEPYPQPFIERNCVREVEERVKYNGEVIQPLEMEQAIEAINLLLRAKTLVNEQAEGIAICLLHSYACPEHEQQLAEYIRAQFPSVYVTMSATVCGEIREYERMSTTVLNAYLGPATGPFLHQIEDKLTKIGLQCTPLIMQSNGGIMGKKEAQEKPVRMLYSGPAGGIMASRYLAEVLGHRNVITMDVGGTSFDVGLIYGGEPVLTPLVEVDKWPVLGQMIEIDSIGAGGGSIARVNEYGVIKVGPQSAGAEPGPICYGKGGTAVTVADANLVLGYLSPDNFLGGRIKLDSKAAETSIKEQIAAGAKLTTSQAADAIFQIVNAAMVDAVRLISVKRGKDPREFVAFAFGGAGAVHCPAMHKEIGTKELIVPRLSSVFSAFGLLTTNLRHDYARTHKTTLDNLNLDTVNQIIDELAWEAQSTLLGEGIAQEDILIKTKLDLSYIGQIHELPIDFDGRNIAIDDIQRIKERYTATYEQHYGFSEPNLAIQLVTVRVQGVGIVPKMELPKLNNKQTGLAFKGYRQSYFYELGVNFKTPIYNGALLAVGEQLKGPAIIEYDDTTVVIRPHQDAVVDDYGNLIIC